METIPELLDDQAGVIARFQALAAGMSDTQIRRMLRRREWVGLHPGVYVNHTGEPTWLQRAWAAVLFAWPAALCDVSALRAAEGPGRRSDSVIHVAVDRQRARVSPEGVRVHRMAHLRARAQWNVGPPRLRYEEATLDVAVAAPSELIALDVLAGAVQSRRTTAIRLRDVLASRERTPRRRWLVAVLEDIAAGACSVLEQGYLRHVERAHGLPRAERQVRASATLGVVYRDAQYDGLTVELDGRLFHDTAAQRDRDFDRDLDAAVERHTPIRISYGQVFDRPCRTAVRIAVLLAQRGWTGTPTPCGPDCVLRGGWTSLGGSQPPHKRRAG